MPSFKVLFKGVEMIKNHCSGIQSTAIELFIATKAMLTLNCVSVRYYWGPHWELEMDFDASTTGFRFSLLVRD